MDAYDLTHSNAAWSLSTSQGGEEVGVGIWRDPMFQGRGHMGSTVQDNSLSIFSFSSEIPLCSTSII